MITIYLLYTQQKTFEILGEIVQNEKALLLLFYQIYYYIITN
jgi:hypothetical protein